MITSVERLAAAYAFAIGALVMAVIGSAVIALLKGRKNGRM